MATSDFAASSNYSISWSIGEISAYSKLKKHHHLTGGFQQGSLQAQADNRSAGAPLLEGDSTEQPLHKQSAPFQVDVLIYPNPTMQELSLSLDGFAETTGQVLIFNASAQQVIAQSFDVRNQNTIQIDQVATLPPGKYVLQIYQNRNIKWASSFVKI